MFLLHKLESTPHPLTEATRIGELLGEAPHLLAFAWDYLKHVLLPAAETAVLGAPLPVLPMIDPSQSKENALPGFFAGLFYENWQPDPAQGSAVFLSDLSKRGPNNLRKRIFSSAMTPDLYADHYRGKVRIFLETIFAPENAGKPFMAIYNEAFHDLYWSLHIGLSGADIPDDVRDIFTSFVTVFSTADPRRLTFYEAYMDVRRKRPVLMAWIKAQIERIKAGEAPDADKTFAYYWLKNSAGHEGLFSSDDIAFECYTDFLAVSQWAETTYRFIEALCGVDGEDLRTRLAAAVAAPDPTALGRFVMEMLRLTCPNERVMSVPPAVQAQLAVSVGIHFYDAVDLKRACRDPLQWQNPEAFDPDRFLSVPTSDEVDEEKCQALGLATCPFSLTTHRVADGRDVEMANSGFGTVYGVFAGKAMPVCDHAGYAPFGYGYRRCPGEQLTQSLFEDFLRIAIERGIVFERLDLRDPASIVVGPVPPVPDWYGFSATGPHRR